MNPAELIAGQFDPVWYAETYTDVRDSGCDPLDHYLTYGRAERRMPNGLLFREIPLWFDCDWYLETYADVRSLNLVPFEHYRNHGHEEGRSPNRVLGRLGDVVVRPPLRPTEVKIAEQIHVIRDAGIFDEEWYAERFVISSAMAMYHYVIAGAFLGNDPNPFFSSLDYFAANPDCGEVGENPILHFIKIGYPSGRSLYAPPKITASIWQKGLG